MEEKVNYYYQRLLYHSDEYNTRWFVIKEEEGIKKQIKKVIENNYDYLLSESLINYISSTTLMISQLARLYLNNYERMSFLSGYLFHVSLQHNNKEEYSTYVKLIDKELFEITERANNYVKDIKNSYDNTFGNTYKSLLYVENIIYIVLAHCYTKNDFSKFDDYCKMFMNTRDTYEDFLYNGIITESGYLTEEKKDSFYDRVVSRMESTNKRIIN